MKVFTLILIVSLFLIQTVSAQEQSSVTFSAYPNFLVPIGPTLESNNGESPYSAGAGLTLAGDLHFGAEQGLFGRGIIGYSYLPIVDGSLGETDNLSLIHTGLGGGIDLPLFKGLLSLKLNTAGGIYQAMLGGTSSAHFFALAGAEIGYNLSSGFRLHTGADYARYFTPSSPDLPNYLYEGISVRLGGTLSFSGGTRKSRIEIIDIQIDPVYPILHGYYDTNSIGTVVIKNDEARDIEKLRVSLYIPQYMDRPKVSPVVETVPRGETVEVPLYALLTDEILSVTEDGVRVSAEIGFEYSLKGNRLNTETDETAVVQNRNALTWTDDRKAAAFVTAKDNTVLRMAKQVAGVERKSNAKALDENFRKATAIYETLGLVGLEYVVDPESSYIELSKNPVAQDYVQFPAQTLDYRAGDCDDLSILYTAMLEAVNVETAFITVPGHIYTAFALSISEKEARRTFDNPDDLIFADEKVWVPVEATVMDEGFEQAWNIGARQWREYSSEEKAELYPVREAWQTYQAVASPLAEPDIAISDPQAIAREYSDSLENIIQAQIDSRVARLKRQVEDSRGNPAIVNRLGVLYARYGLYDQAMDQFLPLAEKKSYPPALINTANIYFMREQYARALAYYSQAADSMSNPSKAKLGIARAQYKLENYSEARRNYQEVASANPELAERFTHLNQAESGNGRASSAAVEAPAVWEE